MLSQETLLIDQAHATIPSATRKAAGSATAPSARALCGQIEGRELGVRDADGMSVGQALSALGLPPQNLASPGRGTSPPPGAFIEQGTSLAERGLAVGVVSEIVAIADLTVRFSGERAHADGTAMTQRRDVLLAAARFVLGAHSLARSDASWRATAGELSVTSRPPT